ncbi:MAG: FapA family protein [bacterium]
MSTAGNAVGKDVAGIGSTGGIAAETVKPGQTKITIEIAPNGLTATAGVKPTISGDYCSLKDLPFIRDLIDEDIIEESPPTVDPRQVTMALKNQGIVVGIDVGAIAALMANPTDAPRVVARGLAPTPGQDASVELKFEQETSFHIPTDDSQKIDWRKLIHVPTVKVGDELAVKHSLRPGKPGLSVTGEVLAPPKPKDVELKAGEGCKVVDNMSVVATRNGRPAMVQGRIVVFPVLVQEQGVKLSTGNIKFDGDVVVKGNVEDNMAVEAGGDIDIMGNANNASLKASGRVVVYKNLIGGSVQAGGVGLLHLKHCADWERLTQKLEDCTRIMTQMTQHPEFAQVIARQGWVLVLQKLVDSKFSCVRELIEHLTAGYKGVEGMSAKEVWDVLTPLQELLQGGSKPENAGIGKLIMVTKIARGFHESMSETNEDRLSFKACYVQGTYVEASGDIIVFGPGCYQSHLYAGRAVHVQGRPGVVRGGVVYSRKEVIVNEAGSLAGTPTLLRVDAKGTIKINKVHPNVTIQVGSSSYKFGSGDNYVVARINDRGHLVIH